jgi:hypothetical protein
MAWLAGQRSGAGARRSRWCLGLRAGAVLLCAPHRIDDEDHTLACRHVCLDHFDLQARPGGRGQPSSQPRSTLLLGRTTLPPHSLAHSLTRSHRDGVMPAGDIPGSRPPHPPPPHTGWCCQGCVLSLCAATRPMLPCLCIWSSSCRPPARRQGIGRSQTCKQQAGPAAGEEEGPPCCQRRPR